MIQVRVCVNLLREKDILYEESDKEIDSVLTLRQGNHFEWNDIMIWRNISSCAGVELEIPFEVIPGNDVVVQFG